MISRHIIINDINFRNYCRGTINFLEYIGYKDENINIIEINCIEYSILTKLKKIFKFNDCIKKIILNYNKDIPICLSNYNFHIEKNLKIIKCKNKTKIITCKIIIFK
jgi:hypothetical protein